MRISYSVLKDKILGCWNGKNIGGVLGAPYECCVRGTHEVTFYDQDFQGNPPPNDDLDLQLVFLHAAEQYGAKLNAHILAEYWTQFIIPNWSEYGNGKRNLRAGLLPPLSGGVENPYKDSNGAWIRTELWACLAPGNPELAVRFAYEDAIVDHAHEGVYATAFCAAIESAAFAESDLNKLIDIALSYIPSDCRVYDAVRIVREAYAAGKDWKQARFALFCAHPSSFGVTFDPIDKIPDDGTPQPQPGMDAPNSVGIIVLALLYGEGDFGKSICTATNCGEDTDCTAGTVGAIYGIIYGNAALPEKWVKPIDGVINTVCIDKTGKFPIPKNIYELTERVIGCVPKMLDRRLYTIEGEGISVETAAALVCPPEYVYYKGLAGHGKSKKLPIQQLLKLAPYGVRYDFGSMGVIVDYCEDPFIAVGESKKIKLLLWDAGRFSLPGQWADVRIYTDDGIALACGNYLSAPLRSNYGEKTEFEIEFVPEQICAPTVNLVFDITVRGRSTNAIVKASFYPGKHKIV